VTSYWLSSVFPWKPWHIVKPTSSIELICKCTFNLGTIIVPYKVVLGPYQPWENTKIPFAIFNTTLSIPPLYPTSFSSFLLSFPFFISSFIHSFPPLTYPLFTLLYNVEICFKLTCTSFSFQIYLSVFLASRHITFYLLKSIVEASFMMLNQDWFKLFWWWQKTQENDFKIESKTIPKRMISRLIESRTIQESREIWFQDSIIKFEDSRLKIQESRQDSIKISTKKFFKTLSSIWSFHKSIYQRVFTLW